MKKTIALKTLIIFLLCALTCALAVTFSGGAKTVKASETDTSPTHAFGNSSIVYDVDENKVMHVREKLTVGFLRTVTSLTRRIPAKSQSYSNRNGKSHKNGSFLARISNVSATVKKWKSEEEALPAETSFNKNGTNYYLSVKKPDGRSYEVWEKGHDDRQYEISLEYDLDLSDDGAGKSALAFNVFDEVDPAHFYFGDDKDNKARLNVTINMPKPFDSGLANVFYDGKKFTESSDINFAENSVNFSVSFEHISKNSVRILLDGNYFNTSITYYSYYWYFVGIVGIVILISIVLTIIFHGRQPVSPVEVEPPVVNPLHYSAYWHGYPQRKDVCTIVLRWAQLGCIKIEKDGKKDLILTRLKPLPEERSVGEKRYFAEIFREGNVFHSKETRGFANRRKRDRLRCSVNELVEESEKPTPFAPVTERTKTVIGVLSMVAVAAAYAYFIVLSWDWIWLAVVPLFLAITVIPLVKLSSMATEMSHIKQKDLPRYRGISIMSLCLIVPLGLFCWFLFSTQYMGQYDYIHITIISIIWVLVSLFVLPKFITKRTDEANVLYGRMLGFKRFIQLADLPKMEMLLKDNPDYFYDVLPYCMVMGLSKKIDKQMQYLQVAVPDWAVGFSAATFAQDLFYSVKHAIIVRKKKDRTRNRYSL